MSVLDFFRSKPSEPVPPSAERCHHHYDNGSRCRLGLAEGSELFCGRHLETGQLSKTGVTREQSEAELAAVYAEVMGPFENLDSAVAITQVLSNLFRLTLQGRIPQRKAALLTSQCRASLRSVESARKELAIPGSEDRDDFSSADSHGTVAPRSSAAMPLNTNPGSAFVFEESSSTSTPAPSHHFETTLWLGHNLLDPKRSSAGFFKQPPIMLSKEEPRRPERPSESRTSTEPRPNAETDPTPKPCYTYQEALEATKREARRIPGNDFPEYKSEDIAVHNGDVNRKKWDGGPIKFNGMSVKEFRKKWRRRS
jgi:hypothetical protein